MKILQSVFCFLLSIFSFTDALNAQVSRQELDALLPSLTRTYTTTDFRTAYERLSGLVEANPGDPLLHSFLSEFALARPNSENASKAFELWTQHLATLSRDEIYKVEVTEAVIRNTLNSPADKYVPIRKFLIRMGNLSAQDPRFYEVLSGISDFDHRRNAELVSGVFLELLKDQRLSADVQKHMEVFLLKKTNVQARLMLLSQLAVNQIPPTESTVLAAVALLDNSFTNAEKAVNYLRFVSQKSPELLRPHQKALMDGLHTILKEVSEGELALRAADLLNLAPSWTRDVSRLRGVLENLLSPTSAAGARRAASGALAHWKESNRDFFQSVYDEDVERLVLFYAKKSGHSSIIKNCRTILQVN